MRIDDSRLDHAERRIRSELHRHPSQDVVGRKASIIVEEEQQVPFDQAHSGVTTSWNAEVLLSPWALTPSGNPTGCHPLPTTTTSSSNLALVQQTGKTAIQIVGPVAHRENNDPERRPPRLTHRSLDEASTATR